MSPDLTFSTFKLSRPGAKRQHVSHRENEDRVLVRNFTRADIGREYSATLLAVADGVSRCADGGAVAEWLLDKRLANDMPFDQSEEPLANQFRGYLQRIHREYLREFSSTPDMIESGCTLCAVLASGDHAAVFWAGDSPAHHLRFRPEARMHPRTLTIADKDPFTGALTDCFSGLTPFAVKQAGIRLSPGDIVIAASDGLAFDAEDLVRTIEKLGYNQEWIEEICERSYNQPFSDDISIAALRVEEFEANEAELSGAQEQTEA